MWASPPAGTVTTRSGGLLPAGSPGSVFAEVGDHRTSCRFDGLFPLFDSKLRAVRFSSVGEENASRAVDDSPQAVCTERRRDIGCCSALTAISGHQQRCVRHRLAKGGKLLRIGGAHDGTDRTEGTTLTQRVAQRFDDVRNRLIKRLTISTTVLECAGTGVTRPHENIDPGSAFGGDIDEWLQCVAAEIRVDRQRISGPDGSLRILSGQICPGVSFCRRPDVAPLGIADDDQPGIPSVLDDVPQHRTAHRSQFFEERRLRFDDWNQGRDHVDHPAAEFPKDFRLSREVN